MKLENVCMGVMPEEAHAVAAMLVNLLGTRDVVVRKLPDTGEVWRHVFVPTRYATKSHMLIAAFNEGVAHANRP